MNIRKLVARLNAKSQRFGGGRGGIPELSPQDIAGAIGMCRDQIGREIFCFAWWPDAANLTHGELHKSLRAMLMTEFSRRFTAVSEAKLALHLLESSERRNGPPSRAMLATQECAYQAGTMAWPRSMAKYDDIVDSVITEVCAPRQCPKCGGRGDVLQASLKVKCLRCKGRGLIGFSKLWRARQLGVNEGTFRSIWRFPYEWLHEFVAEHEYTAAEEIRNALGVGKLKTAA